MTLARSRAVAVVGIRGHVVEVEADLALGLPAFRLVGLPDTVLSESRDRVRAAVANSGQPWPPRRITVSLSPADLPKRGSSFDLAIAVSVLAAAGVLPTASLDGCVLVGELGLDGRVRPVRGVLPAVLAALTAGFHRVVVATANAAEAALVPGAQVLAVPSLRRLVADWRGEPPPEGGAPDADEPVLLSADPNFPGSGQDGDLPDLADVRGQSTGRQALEVAAAGGHHLFLCGPPGAGKTMLARRLPGLLPPLDHDAALEVSAVHSVAGGLPNGELIRRPPFCDPHHTASVPAVVGGGGTSPRPGAVSRSHRGVLFLDEAPEFQSGVLEALRQPLETGEAHILRAGHVGRYPARFLLVLAANPCPCGRSSGKGLECTCTPAAKRRYLGRLSGPLLDRVDLQVSVAGVTQAELLDTTSAPEPTTVVAERVAQARERTRHRLAGTPWRTNSEVPGREMRHRWLPAPVAMRPVHRLLELGELTARGVDRVLRVSWTLADLQGRERPSETDVATAVVLRAGQSAVAA